MTTEHPKPHKSKKSPVSDAVPAAPIAAQTVTPVAAAASTIPYENNPFMITIKGIQELFGKAQAIAITLIVLAALGLLGNLVQITLNAVTPTSSRHEQSKTSTSANCTAPAKSVNAVCTPKHENIVDGVKSVTPAQWAVIGIVVLIALVIATVGMLIGTYVKSVLDYTATRVALGEKVGFSDALSGGMHGYFPYLWIQIIVGFKTFLWSLLFVVPGIIMSIRYSLAGMSFYDTGKRGNAAVKDSLTLTKGAWLTTFASYSLFNMLVGGIAEGLFNTGSKVVLYRQLSAYERAGLQKPAAHALSWVAIILPILAVVFLILIVALLFILFASVKEMPIAP